jgi:hypothetical protein
MLSFGLGALPPLSISNNLYYACIIMQKEFKMAGLKSVVGKFALALKNVPTSSTKGPKPSVQTNRGLMTSRPDGLPRRPQVNPAQLQQNRKAHLESAKTEYDKYGQVINAGHINLALTPEETADIQQRTGQYVNYYGQSPVPNKDLTSGENAARLASRHKAEFVDSNGVNHYVTNSSTRSNGGVDTQITSNNVVRTDLGPLNEQARKAIAYGISNPDPYYQPMGQNAGTGLKGTNCVDLAAEVLEKAGANVTAKKGTTPDNLHQQITDSNFRM